MSSDELFWIGLLGVRQLRLAKDDVYAVFGEDVPKTILFANIGKAVVRHFDSFAVEEKVKIFQAIEEGLQSKDTQLSTCIATGFLESLYSTANSSDVNWSDIAPHLGLRSKKYVEDWVSWSSPQAT